jgi:predicted GNAT family acetyltransferase
MADFLITDNRAERRYETIADGMIAILEYDLDGDRIKLRHTEVPVALEGRGIGGALARHALEDAKARGLIVVPTCLFVTSYLGRHPEYVDIVAEEHRARIATG